MGFISPLKCQAEHHSLSKRECSAERLSCLCYINIQLFRFVTTIATPDFRMYLYRWYHKSWDEMKLCKNTPIIFIATADIENSSKVAIKGNNFVIAFQ